MLTGILEVGPGRRSRRGRSARRRRSAIDDDAAARAGGRREEPAGLRAAALAAMAERKDPRAGRRGEARAGATRTRPCAVAAIRAVREAARRAPGAGGRARQAARRASSRRPSRRLTPVTGREADDAAARPRSIELEAGTLPAEAQLDLLAGRRARKSGRRSCRAAQGVRVEAAEGRPARAAPRDARRRRRRPRREDLPRAGRTSRACAATPSRAQGGNAGPGPGRPLASAATARVHPRVDPFPEQADRAGLRDGHRPHRRTATSHSGRGEGRGRKGRSTSTCRTSGW